ncbi:MAG: hypothetical protein JSR80_04910 [Verrucomicrobia bacterium]|nr:hypothetical protein [Verrucomicrobiota bacterium]
MAKVCESSPLPYLLGATIVATAVAGYMGKIGKKTTAAAIGSLSLATLYVVLTAPERSKTHVPCAFCNAKVLNETSMPSL